MNQRSILSSSLESKDTCLHCRTHSCLPYTAAIFSNYVVTTVAGLISDIATYNCISSFISVRPNIIDRLCAGGGQRLLLSVSFALPFLRKTWLTTFWKELLTAQVVVMNYIGSSEKDTSVLFLENNIM